MGTILDINVYELVCFFFTSPSIWSGWGPGATRPLSSKKFDDTVQFVSSNFLLDKGRVAENLQKGYIM